MFVTVVDMVMFYDTVYSDCFCAYFIQRFRTILGKSRLLKPEEKVSGIGGNGFCIVQLNSIATSVLSTSLMLVALDLGDVVGLACSIRV